MANIANNKGKFNFHCWENIAEMNELENTSFDPLHESDSYFPPYEISHFRVLGPTWKNTYNIQIHIILCHTRSKI
jgi:hypothetical protein